MICLDHLVLITNRSNNQASKPLAPQLKVYFLMKWFLQLTCLWFCRPDSWTTNGRQTRPKTDYEKQLSGIPKNCDLYTSVHSTERGRFELPVTSLPHSISSRAQSTTLPPLHVLIWGVSPLSAISIASASKNSSSNLSTNPAEVFKPDYRQDK